MSLAASALRLSLRATRVALRTARDAAEAGLEVVDLADRALGGAAPEPEPVPDVPPVRPVPAPDVRRAPVPRPAVVPEPPEPEPPELEPDGLVYFDEPLEPVPDDLVYVDEPVTEDVELVGEVAEPGAEEGAGAQIRIDPPWAGYDALRAADVIARVRDADAAQLAAIELYESSHKRRRTVLEAVAREARRPR